MNFVGLQALRALAAIGVVLFHILPFETKYLSGTPVVPQAFLAGRAGVDLFFVLSGFLAVWTTASSPGGASAAREFLLRRVTRIYPLYWFYCLLLIVIAAAAPAVLSGGGKADVLASLLLVPNASPPLLLVAWTLEFEIYFYLVFAALIWARLGRGKSILVLALWAGLVIAGRAALAPGRAQAILDALLSPLVFEFLAGCAAAYLCRVRSIRAVSVPLGLAGCVVFTCAMIWSETLFVMPWVRVAAFGIGCGMILVGCCGADGALRRVLPHTIIRIGDASYSLYLSHLFVLAALGHALSHLAEFAPGLATPAGHAASLCVAVLATLLVAEASRRWLETPLLRLTRHMFDAPRVTREVRAT